MSVFYQSIPITEETILDIVNEAYFGKTESVRNIINQLGIVRRGGDPKGEIHIKHLKSINTHPAMIELDKLIEKEFGFSICSLTIVRSSFENAYTIPISVYNKAKASQLLTASKAGFRYKPDAHYSLMISITSSVFFNPKYTDEEVTALLFHEIGHNFQEAIKGKALNLSMNKNIFGFLDDICDKFINDQREYNLTHQREESDNPWLQFQLKVANVINTVSDFFNNLTYSIDNILTSFLPGFSLLKAGLNTVLGPVAFIDNLSSDGIRNEQIADSFPGMYGLGVECSTALAKLENQNPNKIVDAIHNTPVIGHLANFMCFPAIFTATLFDEHPQLASRFKGEISVLKQELKSENLDPRIKKEIQTQIDEINKAFDKFVRTKNDVESKNDPQYLRKKYQTWLFDKKNGDIRSGFYPNSKISKTVDKAFTNALESVEFE